MCVGGVWRRGLRVILGDGVVDLYAEMVLLVKERLLCMKAVFAQIMQGVFVKIWRNDTGDCAMLF